MREQGRVTPKKTRYYGANEDHRLFLSASRAISAKAMTVLCGCSPIRRSPKVGAGTTDERYAWAAIVRPEGNGAN